ncbi:MAG: aminopeptidase [Bacteroidetes bacterium]|nr:MAG: aminopeptidase [Bacteroidota bacterium]RLD80856.1 MAG: aminopeptidase [Bacteroidota bacterium]
MNILKTLCNIHSPSGEELKMKEFLIDYINSSKYWWKKKPKLIYGNEFQDNLLMLFGKPKVALIAHMDTVGYTVRYDKELIPIGSPVSETGYKLRGEDSIGRIDCLLHKNSKEYNLSYIFKRLIKPGTSLSFKPNFRLTEHSIQSPYLDNRMGIWLLLKLAETLNNGIIAFTCWEEHGGGSVEFITKYLYEKYKIQQIIIADTTYTSEGINHDDGVVISLRDENIPRKSFVDKIQNIASVNNLKYQLEVEYSGGSDGASVQKSPYPVDWCFVGPPISNIHSPDEIINKNDIFATLKLYQSLMDNL